MMQLLTSGEKLMDMVLALVRSV